MADELKVYLDHLIPRENLRFKRSDERLPETRPQQPVLRISDLLDSHVSRRARLLRKPDFQRASWAWTPDDCVSLLDSLVNEQVIPSIIMWSSPENTLDYVLDGAHRVSVVLAWLNDDWGDKLQDYHDDQAEKEIKQAAAMVRSLVRTRIGNIDEYKAAEQAIEDAIDASQAPKDVLEPAKFKRGQFFRKLVKGDIHFHILWVNGDYETAEQSFLKINKSGRQLLEWETKLIENRNSSFARAVMSIANITTATHYWLDRDYSSPNKEALEAKKEIILDGVERLNKQLFVPPYSSLGPICKLIFRPVYNFAKLGCEAQASTRPFRKVPFEALFSSLQIGPSKVSKAAFVRSTRGSAEARLSSRATYSCGTW